MKPSDLLQIYADEWRVATHHPFLQGIHDGTLDRHIFATWLAQDYHFVRGEFVAIADLLTRAPRLSYKLLTTALVALEEEMSWFEEHAHTENLSLTAALLPTTVEYQAFLLDIAQQPFPAAITSIWAIERAYLDAWKNASHGDPLYRPYADHWANAEFEKFVQALEATAAAELAGTSEYDQLTVSLFLRIAQLECDFWDMAYAAH